MTAHANPVYPYARAPEQESAGARRPVIVVGAGPVGLAAAIDLAQRDVPVVLLDEDNTVSVGSRAICYAKRTLEILDRLGCGEPVAAKGVRWNVGRVFHGSDLAYQFDLLPEQGHRRPAFINLQQYYFEEYMVQRAQQLPALELRWQHKVVAVTAGAEGAAVRVATPDGEYTLDCAWLVVADGARSPVRGMLGLDTEGQVFRDRFLIADIRMDSEFPAERWFWFDPPFHRNQSALLHRQADDIWRIDFQLGWDADPELEKRPERIMPRLRAMLGDDAQFEIVWASVYTFQCRRMRKFRHGRVLFAGDAAHLVSPFGARGANSGVQDADNLGWKLALVVAGTAPEALLDSYDAERGRAADENIRHSTRSTDFITPKSDVSRLFRDAVLALARHHPFARSLVNSGRLSVPVVLHDSHLNTPDRDGEFALSASAMAPGAAAADAPVLGPRGAWFLGYLEEGFTLVVFGLAISAADVATLEHARIPCRLVTVADAGMPTPFAIHDRDGWLARRYDARPGTTYLFRPDQHVCARWRTYSVAAVLAAIANASGIRT